jgi:hypothetical protein
MKIKLENIQRLNRNASLMSLYNNTYLNDPSNENFVYIRNKFFKHEWFSTSNTLNNWTWLFSTIADVLWNYTGSPYWLDITKQAIDFNVLWFCVVVVWMKTTAEWKPYASIIQAPSEWYFMQDWIQYIARLYQKQTMLWSEYFLYLQWFYDTYIENKLYKLNTAFLSETELQEVPLNTITDTSNLQEIEKHPFWSAPIFLITSEENNIYPSNSEINKCKPQVYSMDRKKIMFDTEFLKNVESFLLLKWIPLPRNVLDKYEKGTRIDFADLWRVVQWNENSSLEFISNTNSLIKDAMESQKDDMRMISTLTSIPLDFLWMDTAHWSLWKGSRWLLHWAFVKKIESLRKVFDQQMPFILKMLNDMNKQWEEKKDLSYSRPDVFSQSDSEILDEVALAVDKKIMSRLTGMKMYLWYNDEQAIEEIKKIDLESKIKDESSDQWSDTSDTGNDWEDKNWA